MKILTIGDISGRPGRQTMAEILPNLKREEGIDFVIANCENAAGGYGVTREIIDELTGYGVDFFTSGDHVWKVKSFIEELQNENLHLVRPYNYERQEQLPGKGFEIIDMGKERLVIANLIGQVFMHENVRNPFWAVDELLEELVEKGISQTDTIIVDFHAEATAEKLSLGYYLKDKVSVFFGTHTHVPTADQRIIGRSSYVTDLGMVGPLDASLWAEFGSVINNFKYPFKLSKKMEMEGNRIFNSVLVEVKKGRAISIKRIDKTIKK